MSVSTVFYGEFEMIVHPETNKFGAWIASVSLKNNAGKVVDIRPMTVQPEWLTEDEAIRDAIEWGRRFIEREFESEQPHSWVSARARAEDWFRDAQEKSHGPDISS